MTQQERDIKKAYELVGSINSTLYAANESKNISLRKQVIKSARLNLAKLKNLAVKNSFFTLERLTEVEAMIIRMEAETRELICHEENIHKKKKEKRRVAYLGNKNFEKEKQDEIKRIKQELREKEKYRKRLEKERVQNEKKFKKEEQDKIKLEEKRQKDLLKQELADRKQEYKIAIQLEKDQISQEKLFFKNEMESAKNSFSFRCEKRKELRNKIVDKVLR